ncbi:MAG: ABC transporter permease subunit [Streptosporangiales bacterium]|nr:ABC transporter permease subunit [Streptosporangiales bacterium]
MTTSRAERAFNYTVLAIFSVIAAFPLLGVVWLGLRVRTTDVMGIPVPTGASFGAIAEAWQRGHFATYLTNSAFVVVVVVLVAVLLSILAGYALGTMDLPGGNALFYLFLLGLMVPTEALVIPLFFDLRSFGLDNSFPGLILPQIAQSLSFGTFWMRAYFRSVPGSLIEAARMDGAGSWTTLWRVLVPVGRPAVVTMIVLIFMWTWNEFLLALVIMGSREDLRTAPLGLSFFQGQFVSDYDLLAAGAGIVALPVMVVYVFLQRHFIAGMLSGALKE